MNMFEPVCRSCGTVHPVEAVYACRKCGGSLDIRYDYERIFADYPFAELISSSGWDMWNYRPLLPILPEAQAITLGEGGTPLLRSRNIQDLAGLPRLYLKLESVNPTLAFKDRPLSVALTAAMQFGMQEVVCASTGNTGVAAAAYAARAGLRCTVYVPASTPMEKLGAMKEYGAELQPIAGSFSDALETAMERAVLRNAFNLTSTYLNPYAIEGNKTVAYELLAQLGHVPDWIVVPIGAGPLLSGIYKGFQEMKRSGFVDRLPRMVGVQADGCAPIAEAYRSGAKEVLPWRSAVATAASGIADPLISYPADGSRTLSVIRESGGIALSIPDDRLLHYRKQLAMREGVLAELSSVTAVAAVQNMLQDGVLRNEDTVIAIVTGHGFKDMSVQ